MPNISEGRFVVVGGASLLGSHIGEQLLAKGAREIVLIDNLALGSTKNIDFLLTDKRCSFVRGDALRLNELYDPMVNADGVFAVAGFLAGPLRANPWLGIDVNVRGLQNILEASRYQRVKKVVFSSSNGIYGAVGNEPNTDDSPLRWAGMPPALIMYCASKIMGEGLGLYYQQEYGLDFLALRYSAIYGERQHKRAIAVTQMVRAYESIRAGKRPIIERDGSQVTDYIYAGDAARANLMAMSSQASGAGMNIVSGIDVSQSHLVELVLSACDSDLKPEYYTDPDTLLLPIERKLGFSRARAKDSLGWEPQVSIEEGIAKMVKWLDQNPV
ncbi:NAD(P)-dependent oxidoreductase [Caballeronia novacaledonica]|uniref:NAD-dependent epimerase/dehydratase family protein n=1 Tax=Caballeronia novacaledonica TaxID=1544861 RepID=A0AA37MI25_9BURK|nr:NAD-dependent epimerase/dehydratase family protein [Caballeronia novacaledonica]GJH27073.1 NAD-dependent epimerase/dehydratase family protein [Caballeronia novacaledonica]